MGYSKHSLNKKPNEEKAASSENGLSMPAVSVLQKAAPEEELQMKSAIVQKAAPEEELQMKSIVQKAAPEEELQMKSAIVQKVAPEEELQMKSIVQKAAPEEELQMKSAIVQKASPEEELQMKSVVQKAAPEEELQMKSAIVQKAAPEEELQMKSVVQKAAPEEELQMKSAIVQKASPEEELQMKSVVQKAAPEEELQMKSAIVQKAAPEEELQMKSVVQKAAPEEELQMKSAIVQKAAPEEELQMKSVVQRKENKTGMPDQLKSGIENLSGMDMSDVKVHYNSSQPAQLNALAYAQGSDIHIGPGQEQHLAHEAWHVVQQRQGRVKPTMQMKQGVAVNDDPGLEHEADVMGAKALSTALPVSQLKEQAFYTNGKSIQRRLYANVADAEEEWNNNLDIAEEWEISDLISNYVETTEGNWYNPGFDKQAAITTLKYKIKAKMTEKYEKEETESADLDWGDMKAYLNNLAADGIAKCISITWLGAMGGHNNDTWKIKGLEIKTEVMGSIALDAHTRGRGNKNLNPARDSIKSVIKVFNENLADHISKV